MYKLKTVENMVLNVLISTPDARDDDMRLYYYVCRDCISLDISPMLFVKSMAYTSIQIPN